MRTVASLIALFGLFFLVSCDKSAFTEDFQLTKTTTNGSNGGFGTTPDPNATRDTVTASLYWETHVLRVFLQGLSQDEISYVVGKHVPVSNLYIYSDLHMPTQFLPVAADIDINPIWKEVLIEFNPGFTPYQFLSAAEVDAALHAASPEIRLTDTGNYFRYTVVGK
jgi:hypothetical protein